MIASPTKNATKTRGNQPKAAEKKSFPRKTHLRPPDTSEILKNLISENHLRMYKTVPQTTAD